MTHAAETGAINSTPYFSVGGFWYLCHANLGPDSSGTRFRRRLEHCSILSHETGAHVTEMIIYDLFLFNLHLVTIPRVIIAASSANSSPPSLSATFIFGVRNFHSGRIWYEKPAPTTGARKWSRFMAPVFGACITCV